MARHFISLWLNPFDLWVDSKGWWLENSVSKLWVCLSAGGVKTVSWSCISLLRGWGSLWHLLVNFYMWFTISSCYGSIPLTLGLIERIGGLSTLCHSCRFACQHRVTKTFPGPSYLQGWGSLWHLLVNLYIYLTISFCYGSIPLTLGLIRRDGGLRTLCQSCGFACQQGVLKTFPGTTSLCSEDVVVCDIH